MSDVIIFGASRGLGDALARGVADRGETVWCVSRSRPSSLDVADGVRRRWIAHDLSDTGDFAPVTNALGSAAVSLLIYNAGIWERSGFESASDDEIRAIVNVNLTSLLLAARHLL